MWPKKREPVLRTTILAAFFPISLTTFFSHLRDLARRILPALNIHVNRKEGGFNWRMR
jgi:hypothetical protein